MFLASVPDRGVSLLLVEAGLTGFAAGMAYLWPSVASGAFRRVERAFGRLARRKRLAVFVVGLTALLLRLAILPIDPIPHPHIHDGFSFLLAANTYASGRLTNPTPAMWKHFETFYVDMKPTYMSMYFPAQGMLLAAGKLLTGHAWFGILAATSLMCAAICWMLQAWLPASWALLGGMIAVMRLGLFSYWINSYAGAGSLVALGGALVLGALPRLMKTGHFRYGMLMAVGIVILVASRPYEGLLLCLPVAAVLVWWMLFGQDRPPAAVLIRRAVAPITLVAAAILWMGYYNYRVFGSPLTLPYSINHKMYGMPPNFLWQKPAPEPVYRHQQLREFYSGTELRPFQSMHTLHGFVTGTLLKATKGILFYAGIVLLLPLIMFRRVCLDRRTRFLILCLAVLAAGMILEVYLLPHYLAPFTAAMYAVGLQATRHLRVWRPEGRPAGMGMVRLMVTACVLLAAIRLCPAPLHIRTGNARTQLLTWYGARNLGASRARVKAQLERLPGEQLAIVRFSDGYNPTREWVSNAADIDNSKVIWARDMGAAANRELIEYYKGRHVWLIQPGTPASVTPYPGGIAR